MHQEAQCAPLASAYACIRLSTLQEAHCDVDTIEKRGDSIAMGNIVDLEHEI